jgi:phosphoenolpyruvate-protein kinase (PTS system EI component)
MEDKPGYREINLADSKLRAAKLSSTSSQSGAAIGGLGSAKNSQSGADARRSQTMSSKDHNQALISAFVQVKQSIAESNAALQGEGGARKSQITSAPLTED